MDSNQVHYQQAPDRRGPGWGNVEPPSQQLPRASGPDMKPQSPLPGNPFMPRFLAQKVRHSRFFIPKNIG